MIVSPARQSHARRQARTHHEPQVRHTEPAPRAVLLALLVQVPNRRDPSCELVAYESLDGDRRALEAAARRDASQFNNM